MGSNMSKITRIIFILFMALFCLLYFKDLSYKQFESKPIKIVEKAQEKTNEEDSKLFKDILTKMLEKQLKERNFISRYFVNMTIEEISKQISGYYTQLINLQDDPETSIQLANELIQNGQAYIEFFGIYLSQMEQELNCKYLKIKNKYCTGWYNKFLDWWLDKPTWKNKATLAEFEQIDKLEIKIKQIRNVLKIINRARVIFNFIDWSTTSNSPFAWIARQVIGLS